MCIPHVFGARSLAPLDSGGRVFPAAELSWTSSRMTTAAYLDLVRVGARLRQQLPRNSYRVGFGLAGTIMEYFPQFSEVSWTFFMSYAQCVFIRRQHEWRVLPQ
jgi:hypothetical protein